MQLTLITKNFHDFLLHALSRTMTPAARLQATLELLQSIESAARPADAIVSFYFRARRFIGSKDRAAISTRFYGVLRHHARLGWWVQRTCPLPSEGGRGTHSQQSRQSSLRGRGPNRLAIGEGEGLFFSRLPLLAWLALGEQMLVETINELCSGEKYAPTKLNETETQFLKNIAGQNITHPDMPEDIAVESPPAYTDALRQKFGKDFHNEMLAMLEPAPLDLRINPLKTTRDEILAELKKLGLKAEAGKWSPFCVRVAERPSLNALPMLKDGQVEIQDEGSQLVAWATGAKPGERIVDFCAGGGGKTLAMAAMMANKGKIVACDINEPRLKRGAERFRRAGCHNVETRLLSGERDPWVKKHKESFDRVLCDAPCTGTGTWRRNPDARWRSLGPGLENLLRTQADILDSAARLVKPGGRLVYATCSLLPAENERQIDKFLATHSEFSLSPCGLSGADYLSLTPARHGTDGFFAAVMVKKIKT